MNDYNVLNCIHNENMNNNEQKANLQFQNQNISEDRFNSNFQNVNFFAFSQDQNKDDDYQSNAINRKDKFRIKH